MRHSFLPVANKFDLTQSCSFPEDAFSQTGDQDDNGAWLRAFVRTRNRQALIMSGA
jgi:hypothetical protein